MEVEEEEVNKRTKQRKMVEEQQTSRKKKDRVGFDDWRIERRRLRAGDKQEVALSKIINKEMENRKKKEEEEEDCWHKRRERAGIEEGLSEGACTQKKESKVMAVILPFISYSIAIKLGINGEPKGGNAYYIPLFRLRSP